MRDTPFGWILRRWRVLSVVAWAVFLPALGTVTTVSVAWGLAVVDPLEELYRTPSFMRSWVRGQRGIRFDDEGPFDIWDYGSVGVPGQWDYSSRWRDPGNGINLSGIYQRTPPEEVLPSWASELYPPDPPMTWGHGHLVVLRVTGWPYGSMYHVARASSRSGPLDTLHLERGIGLGRHDATWTRRYTRPHALPLGIVWPAMLANTLFYSAIWSVLILATRIRVVLRWMRIRRGVCPRCRYPIGRSSACTECGVTLN